MASFLEKLSQVDGLGKVKAKVLIDAGVKSIADLKHPKYYDNLPIQTKMYLKYKPNKKIPHKTIQELDDVLSKMTNVKYEILGSFRRKIPTSRDVDIQIVESKSIKQPLKKMDETLSKLGQWIPYSCGEDKMSGYLDLRKSPNPILKSARIIKLDVFLSSPKTAAAMKLYATGSKEWNIFMRSNAKKKGYLLNQDGLYDVKTNKQIPCKTEECIFKKLNIKYRPPEKRSYTFRQRTTNE